jgi:type I restriction enzyme S subunit
MSNEAGSEWSTVAVSEAVDINPRRVLPKTGAVAFLDMASLPLNGAPVVVNQRRPVSSGGARFQAGDTLFARITPCAENGKLGFVERIEDSKVGQGSTEFIVMAARDGLTTPEYVRYLAGWDHVRNHAIGLMEGTSGRQRVPVWAFDFVDVPLPPLNEQRRIAEVLRSVDQAIEAQAWLCSHLRTATHTFAEELFHLEAAANDAPLKAFGDECETVQVGIVVRPASFYVGGNGVPALRSTNIRRNEIDFSSLVQLSYEGHQLHQKSSLRAGDIVTIRTGEPGKTAVIPIDCPPQLNCIDIIFSRPKPELRPHFASYFLNSIAAQRQIAAMQGGLAQQHLNVGEMKRIRLPVPPLDRQDDIVAVLNAAWDALERENRSLDHLVALKRAISEDLLSGRVRVPS